jgi:hypothetical protein
VASLRRHGLLQECVHVGPELAPGVTLGFRQLVEGVGVADAGQVGVVV